VTTDSIDDAKGCRNADISSLTVILFLQQILDISYTPITINEREKRKNVFRPSPTNLCYLTPSQHGAHHAPSASCALHIALLETDLHKHSGHTGSMEILMAKLLPR
jgi:hypothetical protein